MNLKIALLSLFVSAQLSRDYELIDLVNDPTDGIKTIEVDMRYIGPKNLFGKKLTGYDANKCIVLRKVAKALKPIQAALLPRGLSLKVYDCYRPVSAVREMASFVDSAASNSALNTFSKAYYPAVKRGDLITKGYVGRRSGHTNGGAVDIAIFRVENRGKNLGNSPRNDISCVGARHDNALDFGTPWDCMDPISGELGMNRINSNAKENRRILANAMSKEFKPLKEEWWHWSLKVNDANDYRAANYPISATWTPKFPVK
jgi:zinc D-Ala-D-Ala dipeptidase